MKESNNRKPKVAKRGRPPKVERTDWGHITLYLKNDTIRALTEGAASENKHIVGDFLEWHLGRHPLPSHETYQAILNHVPITEMVRGKKTQVIYTSGGINPLMVPKGPRKRRAAAAVAARPIRFDTKRFAAKLKARLANDGH